MSLDTFLNSVVTAAITTLQVSDASINANADDDPVIRLLAKVAYSQITSYCNREFEKNNYVEEYHSVRTNDRIRLRNFPVITLTSVTVDDVALVLGVDYTLSGDRINILSGAGSTPAYPLSNVSLSHGVDVVVDYIGGYVYSDENYNLFNALLMQTTANYNRRSTLGMASVSGRVAHVGAATVDGASDVGDLLDSVKTIIANFVNYCDVDYV